jgi:hypothetical protein
VPSFQRKLAGLILGNDQQQRGFRVALLLCTLLGLGLRVFDYAIRPNSLWQDEAYWAVKALKTAAIDAQIRPLGFMLVTQLMLRLFGAAEWVYRLLPFIGSLVSMALMPYVARRLFRSPWTQLLAVLLLAVNPVALEMAAEFKHYGTEIGVYVAVLAALLHYLERRTARALGVLLVSAWLSFLLSITVIFTYPALFAIVGWDAWQSKRWRRLIAAGGVALVCLGTITTIYFTTWRTIKTNKAENKWGTWYDVFYIPGGLKTQYDTRLGWTTAKYAELASVPGIGRQMWSSERIAEPKLERAKRVDLAVWAALHVLGLAWLARRKRFVELATLWSPLLLVVLFNLAGRWPAGAFRTNTFYVPFAILLASFGCEWLTLLPARLRYLVPGVVGLLLLPSAYFRPAWFEKGLWAKPGEFREALELLPTAPRKNQRKLIMDFESCRPWDYYSVHNRATAELGRQLRKRYSKVCRRNAKEQDAEMRRQARERGGFTLLMTDPRKFESVQQQARKYCERVDTSWTSQRYHLVLRCSAK